MATLDELERRVMALEERVSNWENTTLAMDNYVQKLVEKIKKANDMLAETLRKELEPLECLANELCSHITKIRKGDLSEMPNLLGAKGREEPA